jgi:hypothetical protein
MDELAAFMIVVGVIAFIVGLIGWAGIKIKGPGFWDDL